MPREGLRVLSPEEQLKWLKAKEETCSRNVSRNPSASAGVGMFCPQVWDGIMCWPPTSSGKTHEQRCADYIAGFDNQANASKLCLSRGEWFRDENNKTWTNYSSCFNELTITVPVNFSDLDNNPLISGYFPALKTIAQVGYAVSLSTLVIAFCMLASIKKLRCPRNMLHLHLFVSFIMRAFMALLKDVLFVSGVGLRMDVIEKDGSSYFYDQDNWLCKTVTSVWQYCIMANYSWILMEGLYLHNLIFMALFSDTSAISMYVLLGWGLPALFVLPWVVGRALLEDTLCWTTNSSELLFLLIRGPTTFSILLNFMLFVNIVRVLLLKLRASVCDETRTYRRWAKSTLVLVPLFGVHYTVFLGMSYSIGVHPGVEIAWLFCDQLFASFQGFFVAVLYCFLNGEVQAELKRHWLHCGNLRGYFRSPLRPGHCYSNTDCTSLSMGPVGGSRKLRHGSNHLCTSFVDHNAEAHYTSAPNASEATAALGSNSRWYNSECNMSGSHIEMGRLNAC
ncbi:secretin receptor-like isoform X2 [Zootermopsis nevadensis]|uniref:secretin receptor-like isoform X2 n=1 Tax=Zootermopsis nevadensis TaxID=136037 RepID=UPI000B8EC992|nr:secretin receptor-like isoform X2 [Zootermopsis nevadensis]